MVEDKLVTLRRERMVTYPHRVLCQGSFHRQGEAKVSFKKWRINGNFFD